LFVSGGIGTLSDNSQAKITTKFVSQLEDFGIKPSKIHRNLSVENLIEMVVQKNEGMIISTGSVSVKTVIIKVWFE